MKYFAAIVLAILITMPGCAAFMAGADTDAAIKLCADVNAENIRTLAQARADVHNDLMVRLDDRLDSEMLKTKGGQDAADLLVKYRAKRAELEMSRINDMNQIAKVVENAALIQNLAGQKMMLRSKWDALLGRLPAIGDLRPVAEAYGQNYINALNRGVLP